MRCGRHVLAVAVLSLLLVGDAGIALAAGAEFDAKTGYRIDRYRAPVPEDVPGGERIFAADVEKLVKDKKAILIDAMPSEGGRADPETGEWHLLKPHTDIPGSVWLADIGKGELTPEYENYFKSSLERLTAGDKTRALILYCMADCWMSWNSVKRAASYGYSKIYWLSEGTDGWRDWGGTLVDAKPEPLPRKK